MLLVERTTGSLYSESINKLIDKDERFSEIPDELLEEVGNLDDMYDGDVEIHKYNVDHEVF